MSALSLLACLSLLVACNGLNDFQTGKGEVFRGTVVGTAPHDAGDGTAVDRFLLYGFSSDTRMDLRFDAAAAARNEADVGRMDLYTCEDASLVDCPKSKRVKAFFENASLSSIPGLGQDVLSRYDFPGARRIRNFIFMVPFANHGHLATMFVSLMESGGIEVRLVAPEILNDGGVGPEPLFGLFLLERAKK